MRASVSTIEIEAQVRAALVEDVGSGDVTAALIPAQTRVRARLTCREHAVVCGTAWFDTTFRLLDPSIKITWQVSDAETVSPQQSLCEIEGPARAILTGERTAMNFLQTLSGTATRTSKYVAAVAGTGCKILDTRKTIPGLRLAQKYAVACGGGVNHRIGLFDAVLIKENHIAACGSITGAIHQARQQSPGLMVEVEVENLLQLDEAIAARADRILLDNMGPPTLHKAVLQNNKRIPLEASGGIDLDTINTIAKTGVDFISVGGLTKHIHAIDLTLRII